MNNKFDDMTKQEIYNLGIKQGLCIGLEVFEAFGILSSEMMDIILNKVKTVDGDFLDIKEVYEKYKDKREVVERKEKCTACNGSGWYDSCDKEGNPIPCGACNGTGFEID